MAYISAETLRAALFDGSRNLPVREAIDPDEPGRDADHPMELLTRMDPADEQFRQEHLVRAEARIAESEKIIARQKAVIADLELGVLETNTARELVAQFEQLLALQIADRGRLLKELGGDGVE